MLIRVRLVCVLMLVMGLFVPTAHADKIYTSFFSDDAVGGFDTVAYFSEGKPVKGLSKYSYQWQGAKWLFSSEENLAAFQNSPEKYAPQYGGHCAWAVAAKNSLVEGDPEFWRIVDDKLYLNYNKSVQGKWLKDVPGFISKANTNWPDLNK